MEQKSHIHKIKQELTRRCEKNPSYSLRAFAKALKVDVGALSRVINGKQPLSSKMAEKIICHLDLSSSEEEDFFSSVSSEQAKDYQMHDLDSEYYKIISEWYYSALMELTYVKGFKPTVSYISKKLKISKIEAKLALERLQELGLLEVKSGQLMKVNRGLSTTNKHLTSSALRKAQRQYLEKAIYSLENDSLEERNHTNIVMAIDSSKVEIAKQMISKFQRQLCKLLEDGNQDRVYNLSVALFPVQEAESE